MLESVRTAHVVMEARASQVWAPTPVSACLATWAITVNKVCGCLHPTSLSLCLALCLSLSLSVSVYLSLSLFVCLSVSVCLSLCLSLSLSVSLSLSLLVKSRRANRAVFLELYVNCTLKILKSQFRSLFLTAVKWLCLMLHHFS